MQGHSIILSLAGRNLNVSEYISGQWHHDRCARAEGAVLVGLMDRSGKLPEVLADIVAAFLDLPRGTRKKSPE